MAPSVSWNSPPNPGACSASSVNCSSRLVTPCRGCPAAAACSDGETFVSGSIGPEGPSWHAARSTVAAMVVTGETQLFQIRILVLLKRLPAITGQWESSITYLS
jgi:hypothetical protein